MQRPGGYPVYSTPGAALPQQVSASPYGGGVGGGPLYGGGGGAAMYGQGSFGAPPNYPGGPLTPKPNMGYSGGPNVGGPVLGGTQNLGAPQGTMNSQIGRMGSGSTPQSNVMSSGLQPPSSAAAPAARPSATNSIGGYGAPPNQSQQAYGGPQNSLSMSAGPTSAREQVLEKRVRELEQMCSQKDQKIQELTSMLEKKGIRVPNTTNSSVGSKKNSPGRSNSGFRKVSDSKPVMTYNATDQDDPIDVRLEEFYNSTGSAIQFRRINRGFYRFGESIVELQIINHKLMARTEDGWNRGKWGPIEKFLSQYENIEREKAGIMPDNVGD